MYNDQIIKKKSAAGEPQFKNSQMFLSGVSLLSHVCVRISLLCHKMQHFFLFQNHKTDVTLGFYGFETQPLS
jgi:hypothetical protein